MRVWGWQITFWLLVWGYRKQCESLLWWQNSKEKCNIRFSGHRLHWIHQTSLLCTYLKSTMPVLAMAKDKPRIPLPMMALLRLKTDIPKEVWPGCCSEGKKKISLKKVDCEQYFLYFLGYWKQIQHCYRDILIKMTCPAAQTGNGICQPTTWDLCKNFAPLKLWFKEKSTLILHCTTDFKMTIVPKLPIRLLAFNHSSDAHINISFLNICTEIPKICVFKRICNFHHNQICMLWHSYANCSLCIKKSRSLVNSKAFACETSDANRFANAIFQQVTVCSQSDVSLYSASLNFTVEITW